jgi:hypothetical protein
MHVPCCLCIRLSVRPCVPLSSIFVRRLIHIILLSVSHSRPGLVIWAAASILLITQYDSFMYGCLRIVVQLQYLPPPIVARQQAVCVLFYLVLFAISTSTFSKLCKNMYTVACRRVLSSVPL